MNSIRHKSGITAKHCCIFLAILLLLSLIPMLYMSRYTFPYADDFCYGNKAHDAWQQTGSLAEAIKGALAEASYRYNNWQGTFFACFLMAIQPGIFGIGYYQIVPWFLILSFVLANVVFFYSLFTKLLKNSVWHSLSIAFCVIIFSIQCAPFPSQSFYWFNGSIYYTFSHSLALIMFSALLCYYASDKTRRKIIYIVGSSIIAVCVGGSNYTTALLSVLIFFMLIAYTCLMKVNKWWLGIIPASVCLIFLLVSIFAPGNSVRQSLYQDTSLIKAVLVSFSQAASQIVEWINYPYLIFAVSTLPFLISITKKTGFRFRFPALIVLISACCFAACFFPTAYTADGALYERNLDILFYIFCILSALCLYYCVGWFQQKTDGLAQLLEVIKAHFWTFFISAATCVFVFCLPKPDTHNIASIEALHTITSGEGEAYAQAMRTRFEMLENPNIPNITFSNLTDQPWLVNLEDINADSEHWVNVCIANYYHKDSVNLQSSP